LPELTPLTHAETLLRFYEAWNGPDPIAETTPFLHEEFEYVNPDSAVEPGTRHGHAGWLKVGENAQHAFSDMGLELCELIEVDDDRVLALTIFEACGRDSGVELKVPEQHLFSFRDGKIARLQWFHDEPAARSAAGL
jgi:ketosteroid isomerase-like protein